MRALLQGLILTVVVLTTTAAGADPPDRLDSYRLLPRRSVLTQTGGFAGIEQRYRLTGGFDFLQQWEGGTITDPYRQTARFVEPEVWGSLIARPGEVVPAIVLDVDRLLGLEGLVGQPYPILGAPIDVYRFRGTLGDGIAASPLESSTIDLYAALAGPWMVLYGDTTPPQGSADFFEYELRAVARRGAWADWNSDGVVDAADYTALRDEQTLAAASDFDMTAALADWRGQFGESAPDADAFASQMQAALAAASAVSVPEPACAVLLAFGALSLTGRRC